MSDDLVERLHKLQSIHESRDGDCIVALLAEQAAQEITRLFTERDAALALSVERELERDRLRAELAAAKSAEVRVTFDADAEPTIRKLRAELDAARADIERIRVNVFEMHHDWISGDFELPTLAQHDLKAIMGAVMQSKQFDAARSGEDKG